MKKLKNLIAVFAVIAMVVPSLTSFASAAYDDQLSYPNNANEYYDIAQEISAQYGISVNIKSFDSEITISPEEYRKILTEKALQISTENAYAGEMEKECDNEISRNAAYGYSLKSSGTMRVSKAITIYTISALASYHYSDTFSANIFGGGNDVQLEVTNWWQAGNYIFSIDSSGCSTLDMGRTLYVWATGTEDMYVSGLGWSTFYYVTKSAEIDYSVLN